MNIVFKCQNCVEKKIDINLIPKKLFIYDSSHGIAAEIRKKFRNEYFIVCCARSKDLEKIDMNNFFAGIIIVNDYDDFLKIEIFREKIKNLIISSSLKKNNFSTPHIENVYVFDLFLPRTETIYWLRERLDKFEKKLEIKKSS